MAVKPKLQVFEHLKVYHLGRTDSSGYLHAKQKHLGCKKVRGQLEAALQTGATKNFDIS